MIHRQSQHRVRRTRTAILIVIVATTALASFASAAVDSAVVGTWRYAPGSRREMTIYTWTVNVDGSYVLSVTGPDAKPTEAGTFSTDNGRFNMAGNGGRLDAGEYNLPDQSTLIVAGKVDKRLWLRQRQAQPAAAPANSDPGPFDSHLVGTWLSQSPNQGRQTWTARSFEAGGRYRMVSSGDVKQPDETGLFTAANGQWTQKLDDGRSNSGVYKWIDADTVVMRGRFGWWTAWFRASDASAPAAAPAPSPEPTQPPIATAANAPAATPVPPAAATPVPAAAPPTAAATSGPPPGLFPAIVPAAAPATWTGPVDELPVGQWTSTDGVTGLKATYTFRSNGTCVVDIDLQQFRNLKPNGLECKYTLKKAEPACDLDIVSSDPSFPLNIKAIYLRLSKDQLKIEAAEGDQRPTQFTAAATVFSRVGTPPGPLAMATEVPPTASSADGSTPAPAPAQKPAVDVDAALPPKMDYVQKVEDLGPVPPGLSSEGSSGTFCTVSPDGKHFAVAISPNVIMDGKPFPADGSVNALAFTPDSRHLVYEVSHDNKLSLVVDGKAGADYNRIGGFCFSAKGDHLAYAALDGDRWVMVVDARATPTDADSIGVPAYSPDGKHLVYGYWQTTTVNRRSSTSGYVNYDGTRHGPYINLEQGKPTDVINQLNAYALKKDFAHASFVFSPDSTHLAFQEFFRNNKHIVYDWVEGPAFREADEPTFTPDGKHFYYGIFAMSHELFIDGKTEPAYDKIGNIFFSDDSAHYAYTANKSDRLTYVVRDGVEGPPLSNIKRYYSPDFTTDLDKTLYISPDGSLLIYIIEVSHNRLAVVVNNQQSKPYIRVRQIIFSDDGKHYAYIADPGGAGEPGGDLVCDGKLIDHIPDEYPTGTAGYNSTYTKCFKFLPHSDKLVYLKNTEDGLKLQVGAQRLPCLGNISDVMFSADGTHTAYMSGSLANASLYVDGKRNALPQSLSDSTEGKLTMTSDLQHWAVETKNDDKVSIVVDGVAGPSSDFILPPAWNSQVQDLTSPLHRDSFDEKGVLQYLAVSDNKLLRVTCTPVMPN